MEIAGDWQGAAAEYQAALALAEELCSRAHQVDLELNLGFLATRQGEDAVALAHLSRCQSMANQGSLRLQLVYADTGLADLYLRQGKPEAAGPLLAQAEELAKEIDARDRLPEIGFHRALWHLATGDIDAALSRRKPRLNSRTSWRCPSRKGLACGCVGKHCALRAVWMMRSPLLNKVIPFWRTATPMRRHAPRRCGVQRLWRVAMYRKAVTCSGKRKRPLRDWAPGATWQEWR